MTLEIKNGGPYTKQEQEKRREQVFELYFEKNYSALQIAKTLDVNRNTINKDVSFLCTELRDDKKSGFYIECLDKQITKLEYQQSRMQILLEKEPSLKERLQIENYITRIALSISSLMVRIEVSRKYKKI